MKTYLNESKNVEPGEFWVKITKKNGFVINYNIRNSYKINEKGIYKDEYNFNVLQGTLETNAKEVYVSENKLEKIIAPNATIIDCDLNLHIKELDIPNAKKIQCCRNKIRTLNAPNAEVIQCYRNLITELVAPNAKAIDCNNNRIRTLIAPMAEVVSCYKNNFSELNLPNVKILYCSDIKKLKKIIAPKLELLVTEGGRVPRLTRDNIISNNDYKIVDFDDEDENVSIDLDEIVKQLPSKLRELVFKYF